MPLPMGPQLRVLVVDNDPDYLASTVALMRLQKWLPDAAHNLQEAFWRLQPPWCYQYDVVVTDLRMTTHDQRDTGGLHVATKAQLCHIPCVVVTEFSSDEAARVVLQSHRDKPSPAVHYVAKREGFEALLQAIMRLRGQSILHISDLHLLHNAFESPPFDQETASTTLVHDLRQLPHIALNPIQALVVSGDVALRCHPTSFASARSYLFGLADALKISKDLVILVPGNHDVQRDLAGSKQDPARLKHSSPSIWWSKFHRYLEFTEYFYGEQEFDVTRPCRVFRIGDDVAIVAFNSCVYEGHPSALCTSCYDLRTKLGKEHYYGWLDPDDVKRAGAELAEENRRSKRIAVFHHDVPFETGEGCNRQHLVNYRDIRNPIGHILYQEGFRLVLHGHRHQPMPAKPPVDGAGLPRTYGCGAFWTDGSDAKETSGYLLLTLYGYPHSPRLIMRKYCPHNGYRTGYWESDNTFAPNGVLYPSDLWVNTGDTVT